MEREISDFNKVPASNRVHIGIFGLRNAGKSSLINALTGQDLAIVSDTLGTTTDPVRKTMEILPLGPVVITDTPGIDDEGEVGAMRVAKAHEVLRSCHIALLVVDAATGLSSYDKDLITKFTELNLPYVICLNKIDELSDEDLNNLNSPEHSIKVSALTGFGIHDLKELLGTLVKTAEPENTLLGDLVDKDDMVILVTPIDESAPKGRIILPQVQAIRGILDEHGLCMVVQLSELEKALASLKEPPALVITDSQVFGKVKNIVPEGIKLTSFSILFARFKGILNTAVGGAKFVEKLKDGDKILISEGCTHHRQCEDIGTVKLPGWIENFSGKKLTFEFTSGGGFPSSDELKAYSLIVHCGGCMLNEKEMMSRMKLAESLTIPFTNYGTVIAHMNGILDRSLEIFYEK